MPKALEAAIDALYTEPPARFTKSRDALAKSLVAEGDKPAAAEVRARRKPSVAAYALNQIARKFPDEVAELVDVGRSLARAQRKALRGDAADDLREAIARQREALRSAVRKATSLLEELHLPASHLPVVTAALQTALVDPAAGEALEAGRLDTVPEATSDFLGDIRGLPKPPTKPPPKKEKKAAPAKPAARASAAKEALAAKRAAAEEARAAKRRDAEATALATRKAADDAAAVAKKATVEARALEKAAKEAVARARELTTAARRLATRAKRHSRSG